jgi:hypothetical protein
MRKTHVVAISMTVVRALDCKPDCVAWLLLRRGAQVIKDVLQRQVSGRICDRDKQLLHYQARQNAQVSGVSVERIFND